MCLCPGDIPHFLFGGQVVYVVFAGPVYRTENMHRTELDWTTVRSFSSCSCPTFGVSPVASCHVFVNIEKPKKTGLDRLQPVFCHATVGPDSHTYLLNFRSLNHQKRSRIGWDMAKNISVHVFCCKFTWPIIILCTAIWHHKNDNNTHNHLYHVILFI